MSIEITPKQIQEAIKEGIQLRKEYQKRIRKMHGISVEQRFTKCK